MKNKVVISSIVLFDFCDKNPISINKMINDCNMLKSSYPEDYEISLNTRYNKDTSISIDAHVIRMETDEEYLTRVIPNVATVDEKRLVYNYLKKELEDNI